MHITRRAARIGGLIRAGAAARLRFSRIAAFAGLCTSIAPAQTNFWTPVGNPPGGPVGALAYDATTDSIFAGVQWHFAYNNYRTAGAVLRSADHGATWTVVSSDITAAVPTFCGIRALAISAAGVVFAGTDGSGVFRSLDGGAHWSAANSGLGNPFQRALAVDSSGVVYAGTEGGVFVSNNNGGSWTAANAGLGSMHTRTLAAGVGFVLVGTSDAGVFKRVGNGAWSSASVGLPTQRVSRIVRTAANAFYACTDVGLFVSTTNAASWTAVPGPFTGLTVNSFGEVPGVLMVGATNGVFRSIDGGQNWTAVAGFAALRPGAIVADAAARLYAGSVDAGVFRSLDGGQTWAAANEGLHSHTIHRLVVAQDGVILAGTINNGVIRSIDGGVSWQPAQIAGRMIMSLSESPWGELFAGNYTINEGVPDGHAWRSADHGLSWTPLDNGLSSSMVSGFAFGALHEVWCTSAWNPGGVAHSLLSGDVWTRFGPPPNIPAYCLVRTANGDLYFGTEGRSVWRYNAAANAWEDKGMAASQQFAAVADSQGRVFIGQARFLPAVHRSLDGGNSFQPCPNLPGEEGYALLVLPDDEVYVGTLLYGVHRSLDHGDTWTAVNSGIPTTSCFSLTLGPDGYVYAGTAGAGVFRSTQRVACAPQLLVQPSGVQAAIGANAGFSVVATATIGALTYQWRRNGVALADGLSAGGAILGGAASATLTLVGATALDAGAYDCVVTGTCGTLASNSAMLAVAAIPGDANCDGALNNFDIDPFVQALVDPVGYAAAYANCPSEATDVNGDGATNNFDIDAFVACLLGGGCD